MNRLSPTARKRRVAQAQVIWEAAQVLKAHHASHELIAALTEWADKIAPNEGE